MQEANSAPPLKRINQPPQVRPYPSKNLTPIKFAAFAFHITGEETNADYQSRVSLQCSHYELHRNYLLSFI